MENMPSNVVRTCKLERKVMGLAASQARFLAITARKMNCEFQSMQIAQEKLSVTRDLQKAAQDYQSSLNATKLIWDVADDLGIYDVSYDIMMTPTVLNEFDPFLITDLNGKVVLTEPMFLAAINAGIIDEDGNPTGTPIMLGVDDSSKIVKYYKDSDELDSNNTGNDKPQTAGVNDGSRNAFLYQLGKVNKIDMNMADNIMELGETGYTKSGIGGPIFSKTSTNAMNIYSFKEYMKTADYSLYQAAGNTIPSGKSVKDLIYSFDLLSILNDTKNNSSPSADGYNFVENPEKLANDKFVITKNGQALSTTQIKKLTLGDLLDGKYDITFKQDPATKYEDKAKGKFEGILTSLAQLLGHNAPADTYVGLNVDKPSEAALSQAFDFTSLSLTTVTDKTGEGSVMKLCNVADEQNNVISGKNGLYSLSLSNLLKSYLTNFAIGLEGFSSAYTIKTDSASESKYVTSDFDYQFLMKNESAMTDTLMLNADFYNMLYNQIATCGACTDKTKRELVTDNDWLQQQLKRGSLFISSLNTDGYYYQGAYTLNGHVKEVTDENAIARAELEYNVQKSKLNTKEESLELQMKNLDMEISSLTTEYDTVKNLISKSVEKVFTMFSS